MWRRFVLLWASDENAVNSMIEKYSALEHATAAIVHRREDIDARLKVRSAELVQV
ncbi:hypothetical protein BH11MYX1_BH11MYX1_38150 [soil metagenome]